MNELEVYNQVITWIRTHSNLTVIKSHQGGKRPSNPYLMVNEIATREVRQHEIDHEYTETETLNSEGEKEVLIAPVIETEWEYSVHSYGENPKQKLRELRSRINTIGPHQNIDRKLNVFDAGTINNVPDFINNAWEPRANMKIFVRGYVRDQHLIDVIDHHSFNFIRC